MIGGKKETPRDVQLRRGCGGTLSRERQVLSCKVGPGSSNLNPSSLPSEASVSHPSRGFPTLMRYIDLQPTQAWDQLGPQLSSLIPLFFA